jgi:uncharacterized membrane protein YhaH (DUF805 family)
LTNSFGISTIIEFLGAQIRFSLLCGIYLLAIALLSIAVTVRRMHDLDKSGWYILIPIYNLILLCSKGTTRTNQFDSDPTSGRDLSKSW